MSDKHIFSGKIISVDWGEDEGVGIAQTFTRNTFSGKEETITSETKPLALWVDENIYNKEVTVSYMIKDEPITNPSEELQKYVEVCFGSTEARFYGSYSDLTGHLWTNQDFIVGGHDIIKELSKSFGKYIHLEIDIH